MLNLLKNHDREEDLADRYNALYDQGRRYKTGDYLYNAVNIDNDDSQVVDETCREIMVKWCYRITSYCNFSPESACISMDLLDKFLSTKQGRFVLSDRRAYQLASVCSLHITIKMHETRNLDMSTLKKLCRGFYNAEEFTCMERTMLSALKWCLCPPTPYTYLELYLDLLPPSDIDSCRRTARELVQTQIYNSVQDYFFVTVDPSFIALSSLLNALDELNFPSNALFEFLHNVIVITGMDCTDPLIVHLRYRLGTIPHIQSSAPNNTQNNTTQRKDTRRNYVASTRLSPVSVTLGTKLFSN